MLCAAATSQATLWISIAAGVALLGSSAYTDPALACADYYLGKDWVDLDDPSVTKNHVRMWRVLQDLKARPAKHGGSGLLIP